MLNYQFPQIRTLSDVIPAIQDAKEFFVAEREGYKVVNYTVTLATTFPDVTDLNSAIRRECRGIMFDSNDRIIRRPLQKFFNLGEKTECSYDRVNFDQPHVILDKLDGSMIAPFMIGSNLRWGTKMGLTDIALDAETFVAKNPKYIKWAELWLDYGYTPIFEYVSPKNRIVIDYKEENLILVAIRHMEYGQYYPFDDVIQTASSNDIPVVTNYGSWDNETKQTKIEWIKNIKDMEGIVVSFNNGHKIKIKADHYVLIHKNKEAISSEKDIVNLYLNGQIDDVLALLPQEDKDKVNKYLFQLDKEIEEYAMSLTNIYWEYRATHDRKSFALGPAQNLDKYAKAYIFKNWDERGVTFLSSWVSLRKDVVASTSNNQRFDDLKQQVFPDLRY
jgi:RNA ligase